MSLSMTEYLAAQPASRDPFTAGPREHLGQMLAVIAVARNGDYRFLPLLMNKMADVLPRTTNPMLQNIPENVNLGNVDIFDGFGNVGMAQSSSQLQLSMDNEYDRKFSVEEYDKKYSMEMNGSTPDSASNSHHSNGSPSMGQQGSSDMGGSFVSSPDITSPVMGYSHTMTGFIPDMVASPMSNTCQPNSLPQAQHMGHDGMSQRLNGITAQSMRSQGMSSLNSIAGMGQMSQRQGSFHMQGQPQVIGFASLPRAGPDGNPTMVGMNTMNAY